MSGGAVHRHFEAGRVVLAVAGRDSGRFYVVVKWQDDRAYIADGKRRKLADPKAKNPIHLQKTNISLDLCETMTDKKLRSVLRPLNEARAAKLKKGGDGLV